jgi:hypothetical protein
MSIHFSDPGMVGVPMVMVLAFFGAVCADPEIPTIAAQTIASAILFVIIRHPP